MFTVKVVRDRNGEHRTSIYEARSVEIVDSHETRAVVAHMANGDDAYIPVMGGVDHDGLVDVVFIENANGKTTDIVRA